MNFEQFQLSIWCTLDGKTIQIGNWWTWNTNIQSCGFSVVSFNRKSCDFFPASAHLLLFFDKWFVQIYSNVIQSSKQRQLHNSFAIIQWAKLKEAHERFISLQIVKPLKPSANPNKNNQGSHWGLSSYDRNGWNCELDGTSTSIVNFFENHETPFCTSIFTSTFLIAFLIVHTRKKVLPLPYVYYVL